MTLTPAGSAAASPSPPHSRGPNFSSGRMVDTVPAAASARSASTAARTCAARSCGVFSSIHRLNPRESPELGVDGGQGRGESQESTWAKGGHSADAGRSACACRAPDMGRPRRDVARVVGRGQAATGGSRERRSASRRRSIDAVSVTRRRASSCAVRTGCSA